MPQPVKQNHGSVGTSGTSRRPDHSGPTVNQRRPSRLSKPLDQSDTVYVGDKKWSANGSCIRGDMTTVQGSPPGCQRQMGGWSRDDPSCPVERFSSEYNEWKMTAPMMRHRGDAAVCGLGGLVYTVGGCDGVTCTASVERYDPETNTWSAEVSPLSSPRSRVCLLECNGCLIALGGFDGLACVTTVESYDPLRNAWTKLPPMSQRRAGAAAAVLGGSLYVMGGTDGEMPLNSVESYNLSDGCWSVCPPMLCPRENHGCTVFLDRIYVAGGRDELMLELRTAEKFDPEIHRWTPVKPMRSKRHKVSLMVFNNLLLAIGGSDGVSELKTMEAYEPEMNSWRHFGSMKSKHPGGHIAVIKSF